MAARPKYRKSNADRELLESKEEVEKNKVQNGKVPSSLNTTKLATQRSTMKEAIQQLKPIQVSHL